MSPAPPARPMTPPVVFPDVEALLVGVVDAGLRQRPEPWAADVWVGNRPPAPGADHPPRMVTFRSDGGPRTGPTTAQARVGVNVWHESDEAAVDLGNLIGALLAARLNPAVHPVRGVTATLPVRLPETASEPHHVYLTLALEVVGAPL